MSIQFDKVYFNQSRVSGRFRITDLGLGWKASDQAQGGSGKVPETFLLDRSEVLSAHWTAGARGFMLRVDTKNKGMFQFDGLEQDDLNAVKNALQNNYSVSLETRDHSVRGWNWGKADFERSEMVFSVAGKPAFELPYSDVANTNVAKNEVAVEFNLQPAKDQVRAGDELVEMRFYVPGTVKKDKDETGVKTKDENGVKVKSEGEQGKEDQEEEDDDEEEDDGNEESAASVFYQELKEKADIGVVAGESVVSFQEVFFLTPRGKYDIDMYPTFLRLRGKTYDYNVQYQHVQRMFLLPRTDGLHNLFVIHVDPPLRQGQTRYPFLIMQFLRDEDMEVALNVDDAEFESTYAGRLKKEYDEPAHQVVGQVFKGLTDKRLIAPGTYMTTGQQAGVSCSLKASEGNLYPLDKSFLFLPKPPVYIALTDVASITFSRVGGAVSSSRTFDLTIHLRNNGGEHQFSNIAREEQQGLQDYIKSKNIKIRDDMAEEQKRLAAALEADADDSDDDVQMDAQDGSNDEDEESVDEDFEMDEDSDDSDVAEEYDSNHESSGDEDAPAAEPAKKRVKQ